MTTSNGPAPTGGDYTLVRFWDGAEALSLARVGDIVAFELEHDRPPNAGRISDVLWLVWRSFDRPASFQVWADTVAELISDEDRIAEAKRRLPDPTAETPAGAG